MSDAHPLAVEVERQIEVLVAKGYPRRAGVAAAAFRRRLRRLVLASERLEPAEAAAGEQIPVLLVIRSSWVPLAEASSPDAPDTPDVPDAAAYLLLGLETEAQQPDEGRTPLTPEERVALAEQFPELGRRADQATAAARIR